MMSLPLLADMTVAIVKSETPHNKSPSQKFGQSLITYRDTVPGSQTFIFVAKYYSRALLIIAMAKLNILMIKHSYGIYLFHFYFTIK